METKEAEIEQKISQFVSYAMQRLIEGTPSEEIEKDFVDRGISQGLSKQLVHQAVVVLSNRLSESLSQEPQKKSDPIDEQKENAKLQMKLGALALAMGLAITFFSYSASDPGGRYILAYGAIIIGGWNLIRGFFKSI